MTAEKQVLTGEEGFHIQPHDIDASKHFFGAFDQTQTETSASWIIRLLQKRNLGWKPFELKELEDFYAEKHTGGFRFNRLVNPEMVPPDARRAFLGYWDEPIPKGGGWIVIDEAKRCHVTGDFVERCFRASPTAK